VDPGGGVRRGRFPGARLDPPTVADRIAERLAESIGPFNARVAVKAFAQRSLGLDPAQLRPEHVPALLEGLRPMLNTLVGRQAANAVLRRIGEEIG
jgi:hypothetical protein